MIKNKALQIMHNKMLQVFYSLLEKNSIINILRLMKSISDKKNMCIPLPNIKKCCCNVPLDRKI